MSESESNPFIPDNAHWEMLESIDEYLRSRSLDEKWQRLQWLQNSIGTQVDLAYNLLIDRSLNE